MITKTTLAATAAVILSVLSGVAVAQTAAPAAPAAGTVAPAPAAKQIDPAVAKFRSACKADMDKLCGAEIAAAKAAVAAATEPPAKGQSRGVVMACMTANESKLTAECKTAWDERKATYKAKQG
jgi:hypothetical protein